MRKPYKATLRASRFLAVLPRHQDIIARYLRLCEFLGKRPSFGGLVLLMRSEFRKGA